MRFYLTPRMLGAHLLVVLCVLGTGGLGVWQFDAWHTRRQAEAVDLTHQTPVALGDLMGPNDPFPGEQVGAPVYVEGTWVADGTVFVSGRDHDGQSGYWVVTPIVEDGADGSAIPVVRGWTPSPDQAPAVPTGSARLVGWLQPSDSDDAPDTDPDDDVVPSLQIADLAQRVTQDLYSGYVVDADRTVTDGWPGGATALNDGTTGLAEADLTQLPPASTFTAVRNFLYGVEWWFFGGFGVFIWWRFLRDQRLAEDGDEDGDDGQAPLGPPAPVGRLQT